MAYIKTSELDYRAIGSGAGNNEKELRPRIKDGFAVREVMGPSWRSKYAPEPGFAYFATPYTLNTKYVVGCKAAPNIGCFVELPNGKILHLDVDVEQIEREGNRR